MERGNVRNNFACVLPLRFTERGTGGEVANRGMGRGAVTAQKIFTWIVIFPGFFAMVSSSAFTACDVCRTSV